MFLIYAPDGSKRERELVQELVSVWRYGRCRSWKCP